MTGTKVTGAAPVNMVNGSHRVGVAGLGYRKRAIGSQQEGAGTLHAADEVSSLLSRDSVKECEVSVTTDTQTMPLVPLVPCTMRRSLGAGHAVVNIGPTATATATQLALGSVAAVDDTQEQLASRAAATVDDTQEQLASGAGAAVEQTVSSARSDVTPEVVAPESAGVGISNAAIMSPEVEVVADSEESECDAAVRSLWEQCKLLSDPAYPQVTVRQAHVVFRICLQDPPFDVTQYGGRATKETEGCGARAGVHILRGECARRGLGAATFWQRKRSVT